MTTLPMCMPERCERVIQPEVVSSLIVMLMPLPQTKRRVVNSKATVPLALLRDGLLEAMGSGMDESYAALDRLLATMT
ncbi:MAG: hypothetical protein ABI664_19050 [bacterium]